MDLRNLCQRLDVDSLKGMFAIWSLSTLYKPHLRVYWTAIYTPCYCLRLHPVLVLDQRVFPLKMSCDEFDDCSAI